MLQRPRGTLTTLTPQTPCKSAPFRGRVICGRVSNLKIESRRINCKGMFFGRTNLGTQKVMNSLAATPPPFPADSISRIRLCAILRYVTSTKISCKVETQREQTYVDTFLSPKLAKQPYTTHFLSPSGLQCRSTCRQNILVTCVKWYPDN